MNSYFLDTYALIEILKENKNYASYKKGIFITTKLNLLELHYFLLRTSNEHLANDIYDKFSNLCVEIEDDIYINSSKMKFVYKKEKLSFVDCVGYLVSKKRGFRFLTGDNAFKEFENVLFVK